MLESEYRKSWVVVEVEARRRKIAERQQKRPARALTTSICL
jgi:hypothetical protein